MNAILLASAGVVILLVGGGIGFWLGRSGIGGNMARAEQAEAELNEYKRSVTDHFGQTADHFQAIGKQYRELYEHMASGAQLLCEPDEAGKQLLFAPAADAASANGQDPAAEAEIQAEVRPPVDYAEQPAANETVDGADAKEEPAGEQQAEFADTNASNDSEIVDKPSPEATAEAQPERRDEAGERTLH